MDDKIKKTLHALNLNIDLDTIDSVVEFLNSEIGPVDLNDFPYHICAAAAIVSQCRKIPCVKNLAGTTNGIKTENIMKHLPNLSKEKFLETVIIQIHKWTKAPSWLPNRVDALRISYRIFKKYEQVFITLAKKTEEQSDVIKQSLQLFWVSFLFVKNKQEYPDNLFQNAVILTVIVRTVFTCYLGNLRSSQIDQILLSEFQQVGQISERDEAVYKLKLFSCIEKIYQMRFQGDQLNIVKMLQNHILRQRMLDDLCNQYDRFYLTLPQGLIDEMSYLDINRTLTPQQRVKKPDFGFQPIMTRQINFQNDEDDESDHQIENSTIPSFNLKLQPKADSDPLVFRSATSPMSTNSSNRAALAVTLSPFRKNIPNWHEATPFTQKLQNMNCVRGCLQKISQSQANRLQGICKKYCGQQYQKFKEMALKGIHQVTKEFNPLCKDVERREKEMFMLYTYFLGKITNKYSDSDNLAVLSNEETFKALICITVELFNFSYNSLTGQFRRYCNIFGINITSAFKPINQIGRYCGLSKSLETHLYMLEKQILIKQIWDDDTGYRILTSNEQKMIYSECALLVRLKKHIGQRIKELCEVVKVEERYAKRVLDLVNIIIEKKPYLLKHNKIDQIIICSVTFCIKQSTGGREYRLEDIFKMYNQASLSNNSIKAGLICPNGKELSLLEFYNDVFLQEAQDLVNKDNNLLNILSTPMKAHILDSSISGQISINTPFPQRFRDPSRITAFQSTKINKNDSNGYRKELASKLVEEQDEREEEDEDDSSNEKGLRIAFPKKGKSLKPSVTNEQSPRFGFTVPSLETRFSFGKKNS